MTVLDLTVAPPSGKKKALFMFDILLEVAVVPEVTSTPIPPTTSATVLPETVMGPANAKLPIPTPALVMTLFEIEPTIPEALTAKAELAGSIKFPLMVVVSVDVF